LSSYNLEKVAIVGQGYVGFPLAVEASNAGYDVVGFDIDHIRVMRILEEQSPSEDVDPKVLKKLLDSKRYTPTSDSNLLKYCQVYVICVPTPLDNSQNSDLKFLTSAIELTAKNLKIGDLIIVESTIAPGTMRNTILPLIKKISKLDSSNFNLAYSPERIDPLNAEWKINNTPKLISGLDSKSTQKAVKFYEKFVEKLHICDTFEIAEMAKLLENSFRFINISFINEMSILCNKLGIDTNMVISAAGTKPYGFMPFYPSIGVGGHCIPVDPLYLAEKAREVGISTSFIDLANKVNLQMPNYFVKCAEEKLGKLDNKVILVIGIAYKPNLADVRESPVKALIAGLKLKGAHVSWHDDLVKEWDGEKSVALSGDYDLAILATPHDYLDLKKLRDVPLLDTRGSR
jgi:UDP-N-acetyl-D-glucosamine dehydrogenase